jgi:hypothetical protein
MIEAVDDAYGDWRSRNDHRARQEAEDYIATCYGLDEARMNDLRKAGAALYSWYACDMVTEQWLGSGLTGRRSQDRVDSCRATHQAEIDALGLPPGALSDFWSIQFAPDVRRPDEECLALTN